MAQKRISLHMIAVAVILIGLLLSTGFSIYTAKAVHSLTGDSDIPSETQEDDVAIGEYTIRSTLPISDAYRTGNAGGLNQKEQEILTMASAVLDEIITKDMTDYEKELAVYTWMTENMTYDAGALQVIQDTEEDCDNPYGALKHHNAVCVGCATTFRLFMQMLDIPCMVVHNTELYHSWNLVQLEDDWYHVDIYSDSGEGPGRFAKFNVSDSALSVAQDWDRAFFPAAEGMKYNYGYQNRTPVSDIYTLPDLVRKGLEDHAPALFFGFDGLSQEDARAAELLMQGIRSCIDENSLGADFSLDYFDWTWGTFTDDQYVLSISFHYAGDEVSASPALSPEQQEKINSVITQAFGSPVDWAGIEEDLVVCNAQLIKKG